MQLYTKVLLLAFCAFSASLAGDLRQEQNFFRMVLAQMQTSLIDSRALSPAGSACVNAYNNATNNIINKLSNATSACQDNANRTTVAYTRSSNATVSNIRNQSLELQKNIQSCLNETDNTRFLNCTVKNFDKNLQLLDSSNSKAYETLGQDAINASNVQAQQEYCYNSATSDAKVQSIQAINDYNNCLQMAQYQRDLDQPKQGHYEIEYASKHDEHEELQHNVAAGNNHQEKEDIQPVDNTIVDPAAQQ